MPLCELISLLVGRKNRQLLAGAYRRLHCALAKGATALVPYDLGLSTGEQAPHPDCQGRAERKQKTTVQFIYSMVANARLRRFHKHFDIRFQAIPYPVPSSEANRMLGSAAINACAVDSQRG